MSDASTPAPSAKPLRLFQVSARCRTASGEQFGVTDQAMATDAIDAACVAAHRVVDVQSDSIVNAVISVRLVEGEVLP